jgi:hypothetical protein
VKLDMVTWKEIIHVKIKSDGAFVLSDFIPTKLRPGVLQIMVKEKISLLNAMSELKLSIPRSQSHVSSFSIEIRRL